MYQWRKARPTDYEEYERLYNDFECETLYRGSEDEINPQQAEEALRYFQMDEKTLKMLEEEDRRTYGKFMADLDRDDVRIYMLYIKESKKCVGFVQLFKLIKSRWKLAFLCLEPECYTAEVISDLFEYLHVKGKMKTIDVCTLGGKINGILQKIGFKSTGTMYYFRKEGS